MAANSSAPSLSIVTQERGQNHMHHCPTYPGELSQGTAGYNPAGSPPTRSISYQPPPIRETVSMSPRAHSTSSAQVMQGSNAIKQGHSDGECGGRDTGWDTGFRL